MNFSDLKISPELLDLALPFGMRVIGVMLLLLVALFVSRWVSKLVEASLERVKVEATLVKFAAKGARWGVLIIAVVMALGTAGVRTTSFAAILGAAGLAVGLALQGTLSHFASGVMLLIFRPFKVGDVVEIGGRRGKVDEIDLFFTVLDTPDNRRFILPNGQVFGTPIENVTFHAKRRADLLVGTEYSADLDHVRSVLEAAAATVPGQAPDTTPQIVLAGLGASSIDWEVRIWSPRDDVLAISQAGRRAVKQALDAAGIGIPFPQLSVHLEKDDDDRSEDEGRVVTQVV